MNEYLSGDALAKFLHVSKRKMRYFLQNGYIPMYDTGKKTHRYQVRKEDAEAFREAMQNDPVSLHHLKGMFSSNGEYKKDIAIEPTKENSEAFKKFLAKKWSKLPVALPARQAAKLIGYDSRRICEMCKSGVLQGAIIKHAWICTKPSFIAFCSGEGMIARPKVTKEYYALITEFVKE